MVTRTLLRTVVVPAAPAEVWRVIGEFGAFPDWHPHLLPSVIEDDADPAIPGAVRAFTYEGQVVLRERLLAKDPAAHAYRYSVEAPAFPVTGYEARLSVHPHEHGAEVRRQGAYEAESDEAVAQVEQVFGDGTYATGPAALRDRFARYPPSAAVQALEVLIEDEASPEVWRRPWHRIRTRRLPGGNDARRMIGSGNTVRMSFETVQTPQDRALRHVAELSSGPPVDPALRVTLNFHPDRVAHGRSVLASLAEDAVYHSQFVTGTSNGGLTAHPGGDRWRWESRIFNGAYDEAPAQDRPAYGALNFRDKSAGAAPRFGSAHLRLTAETLNRTTFCYPDSFLEPSDFGVAGRMPLIELARADDQDALDDYIEAQVHGQVRLGRDVEALVLDPSFRDTPVEEAARSLGCPLEWHAGFRLTVDELRRHPDYRGREYVELGTRIAVGGVLDPRILGDAARAGDHDPQAIKRVWHCLARFGAP